MDIIDTQNAIEVAEFPKHINDFVWEKKYEPFEVHD
jgi:uncharacterized protein YfeS